MDDAISRADSLADDNGSGAAGPHDVDYSYLGLSTVVRQADGNGVELTYVHQSGDGLADADGGDQYTGLDRFGRVIDENWLWPSSGTTDRFQHGYDGDSNLMYTDNLVNSGESELYHASATSAAPDPGYDGLNRLTGFERGSLSASGYNPDNSGTLDAVSSVGHSQGWDLDQLGNWSHVTTDGSTTYYGHDSQNALTTYGDGLLSASFGRDNAGNMTFDGTQHYFYDAWNRMVTVRNGLGGVISAYTLDALNRRITQTDGSSTRTDLYHDGSNVIEERQGSAVTSQNVWGLTYVNDLVLRDDNSTSGSLGISGSGLGNRLYAQHDVNYNVTSLVDVSGYVQERFVYDPYGSRTVLTHYWATTTDAYNWHVGFQGMWLDAPTGLYHTINRDYSPTLGRWMQMDTGYWDGLNLFQAFDTSPVARSDPTGMQSAPQTQPSAPSLADYQVHPGSAGVTTNEGSVQVSWKDKKVRSVPGPSGRTLGDGPRYGNWGGANWSGGQAPSAHNGANGTAPPVDSSDELYKAHDEAYDAADKQFKDCLAKVDPCNREADETKCRDARNKAKADADRALVAALVKLPADSRQWPHRPPDGNEGGAEWMRLVAIKFFNGGKMPPEIQPIQHAPPPTTQP